MFPFWRKYKCFLCRLSRSRWMPLGLSFSHPQRQSLRSLSNTRLRARTPCVTPGDLSGMKMNPRLAAKGAEEESKPYGPVRPALFLGGTQRVVEPLASRRSRRSGSLARPKAHRNCQSRQCQADMRKNAFAHHDTVESSNHCDDHVDPTLWCWAVGGSRLPTARLVR